MIAGRFFRTIRMLAGRVETFRRVETSRSTVNLTCHFYKWRFRRHQLAESVGRLAKQENKGCGGQLGLRSKPLLRSLH